MPNQTMVRKLALLAMPFALALTANPASATVYVDRASFNAAVPGVVTNNLNALPTGPITSIFGIDTVSSSSFAGAGWITPYTPFGQALTAANSVPERDSFGAVNISFSAPVFALAFDDLDLTSALLIEEYANLQLNFSDGSTSFFTVSDTDFNIATAEFFGFWSSKAISSMSIWSSTLPNGPVDSRANLIDNIAISQVAQPAAVPEPASWVMMLAGFGLVASALRRRRTSSGDTTVPGGHHGSGRFRGHNTN
jgi:PEP-CTERM motif